MKYSLRSLMIVVTLVCVVFGAVGARIEYLRRMAAFHKCEAEKYAEAINAYERDGRRDDVALVVSLLRNLRLEREYRLSVYRPWSIVDETP